MATTEDRQQGPKVELDEKIYTDSTDLSALLQAPEDKALERKPLLDTDYIERERTLEFNTGLFFHLLGLAVLAITAVSAGMTYNGIMLDQVRDGGATMQTKLSVLSVSMALALAMFVGNVGILRLAPLMRNGWLQCLAFLFAIAFTAWVVCVSSWYSLTGMSGSSAMAIYMSEETDRVAAIADEVSRRAAEAKAVLPSLDALAASACANQEAEVASGLGTGGAGVGPFSMGLLSACTAARTVTNNLQGAAARSDATAEKLGATLRKINQTVIDSERSILERERSFKTGMAEVDEAIRLLQNEGLGKGIEAALATLETAVLELPTDNNAFGAKQLSMLQAVKAQMQSSAQALQKVSHSLQDNQYTELKRPGRISVTEVMLTYADRFIPNILIAVGLDVYALFMMSFLLLAGAGKVSARKRAERIASES